MKSISITLIASIAVLFACKNQTTPKASSGQEISFVQNITVKDIASVNASHPSIKFLDVRTPEEIKEGMISGALHADFNAKNFKDDLDKLDRDQSYVVYCRSGGRSAKSAEIMQQMGFKSIYNLEGGYTAVMAVDK